MTPPSPDTLAACRGIDWADAQPAGCRQAAGITAREGLQLAHTPEALDAWGTTLRTRFKGQPVAVCLALDKGPLGSAWAQVYYQQQREQGKAHQAAVRALALQWLRRLYRCWQERPSYDEATYLQALTRRGASLSHNLAKAS